MRKIVFLFVIVLAYQGFGQCPFPVQLVSAGNGCLPNDTLLVKSAHPLSKITWFYNQIPAATVTASVVVMPLQNAITVAGGNGAGAALNQFNNPSSVFVDANGYVYIADRSNFRIMRFPPGSTNTTSGTIVAGSNGPGSALNQFQPNAICVDAGGNLYVADDANSRVLKFPPGSNSATNATVVAGGNGAGKAANQLVNPVSVFVDASNDLYVVDDFNDRVQKFPSNSTSSTNAITVAGGNDYGSKANQFNGPASVFVDKAGNIYVDDAANNRIQKFPPNSTSATDGVTIAGGNGFGSAANQLSTPSSIWGDDAGNIYVADINNERIQMFPPGSSSFTPGETVAGGNGQGFAANQFSGPNVVWGDNDGHLYVSDVGNNRIQKFSTLPVKQYLIDTTFIALVTGTYTAVLTDTLGCAVTTNDVVITPNNIPFVTINVLPGNVSPCTQTKATFSFIATTVNGGALPSYQWQINGRDTGSNSPSFTIDVANGDVVNCLLTSNEVCAVPATVVSNKVNIVFAAKPITSLQNKGRLCAGLDTLLVKADGPLATLAWYDGGVLDTTVQAIATPDGIIIDTTYKPLAAGDYYAIATNTFGCMDTTETININETTKPQIVIQADKTKICAGDSVTFTATADNTGISPLYQWLVNNKINGPDHSVFTTSTLKDNDAVSCIIHGDTSACFDNDTSNIIVPVVYPLPHFQKVSDLSISLGQSVVLSIPVPGNITRFTWSPSSSLSNAEVANPIAKPSQTTLYTLRVISADNCIASDSVKVIVSSPVFIPNAFSPNGDGLNDSWYLLGGSEGDKINKVVVFNRQGQTVFNAKDISFGDRNRGWDGACKGRLQPSGTYIYEVEMVSADNKVTVYKGTVVLVR